MQIRRLVTDDDADSSAIAVTYILAITTLIIVSLAVSSVFVWGTSGSPSNVEPNTHIAFDYNTTTGEPNALNIRVADGDSLRPTNLYLRGTIDGTTYDLAWRSDELFDEFDPSGSAEYAVEGFGGFGPSAEQLRSGQGIELEADNSDLDSYDLDIVWDTGDKSATLDSDDSAG